MAEALAWELERKASTGGVLTIEAEKQTVGELCKWWLQHVCPTASREREESRLKVNVLENWLGSVTLKRVTREVIERRLREMEEAGAAPGTVEHVRRKLRAVFNAARLPANPAAEVSARSTAPPRPEVLSPQTRS